MSKAKPIFRRPFTALFASAWCALAALPIQAADAPDSVGAPAGSARPPASESVTVNLINRLVQRGVLTKQDARELMKLAEADAAEARVQAAMTQLAAAQAEAAEARSQAAAMQAAATRIAVAQMAAGRTPVAPAALPEANAEAPPEPPALPASPETATAAPSAAPAVPSPASPSVARTVAAPKPAEPVMDPIAAALADTPVTESPEAAPAPADSSTVPSPSVPVSSPASPAPAASSAAADAPDAGDQTAPSPAAAAPAAPMAGAAAESAPAAGANASLASSDTASASGAEGSVAAAPAGDDGVRVTYVPQVVKDQIAAEVKQDVMAQARKENWAAPRTFPEWVSRFTFSGDFRLRYESIGNNQENDNTGAFPNFNAINTGAPYDTSSKSNPDFAPQYNVDQDRERFRIRARLAADMDLGEGFTSGFRIATGNDDSPVTENQSLGAVNSGGQGGNFSKYAIWLDRAFLAYTPGGDPTRDLSLTLGRFANPFYSTTVMWAEDLGFDGAALKIPAKVHLSGGVLDSVKPMLVIGAFPIFDTDLNFSSNNPSKFKSEDKWLEAAQFIVDAKLGSNFQLRAAVAYYRFVNVQGELSDPVILNTSADQGDTDDSRPAFAQIGNTYRALRNIVPTAANDFGTIDQWQYFGLASAFDDLAFTGRLDFVNFDPFRIWLTGEYVKNLAFNYDQIAAVAVNNLATSATTGAEPPFAGGDEAWILTLKFGDAVLAKFGDWNVGIGYRKVDSDSVIDGFTDADFGGGGTNFKGYTLTANFALAHRVWLGARWMSATEVAGPTLKNDILQIDINGKF